jgi:hypothetical protein
VGRYAAVLAVDQLDASDLSAPYLDASAAGSGRRNFALLCRSCNADKTLDDDIPAQLRRHDRLRQEANLLEQERFEALCRLAVGEALPGDPPPSCGTLGDGGRRSPR